MYNEAGDVITNNTGDSKEQAEAILLQWLAAWQIRDIEQRLKACTRCKLRTIEWGQHYHPQP
ncbi:hypothetical protein ACWJJH_02690 [Endozoicomonadaceae bacterium StTr2]